MNKLLPFILLFVSLQATAGLIINISDNGSGKSQFDLSGSDIVSSSGQFNNGIWFNDLYEYGAVAGDHSKGSGEFSVLSGAGGYDVGSGSWAINGFYVNGTAGGADWELAIGRSSGALAANAGDAIEFYGSLVADIDYSWFVAGTYFFDTLGPFSNNELGLTDGLTLVIGDLVEVPAPSTLALFGLGLIGIGWTRRKKQTA
ncbi:hypothetical protein R50072_01990 [Simiduia litorea]|uniref:PEP-CTERM sorting domain-containing protein n=1 Tax=Simiduia litorea TaxID=1435348 RepID=UPI0036F29D2B